MLPKVFATSHRCVRPQFLSAEIVGGVEIDTRDEQRFLERSCIINRHAVMSSLWLFIITPFCLSIISS
jgi:hypothetical protein